MARSWAASAMVPEGPTAPTLPIEMLDRIFDFYVHYSQRECARSSSQLRRNEIIAKERRLVGMSELTLRPINWKGVNEGKSKVFNRRFSPFLCVNRHFRARALSILCAEMTIGDFAECEEDDERVAFLEFVNLTYDLSDDLSPCSYIRHLEYGEDSEVRPGGVQPFDEKHYPIAEKRSDPFRMAWDEEDEIELALETLQKMPALTSLYWHTPLPIEGEIADHFASLTTLQDVFICAHNFFHGESQSAPYRLRPPFL